MKRPITLLIVISALVTLGACSVDKNAKHNDFEEFCEEKLFIDRTERQDLALPKRELGCIDDFVYAMDYLAFYRISETVFFFISDDYAETFYNPYTEYAKAYERSDLADVYACTLIDDYYSLYKAIGIRYSISRDIASVRPSAVTDTQIVRSFDDEPRGDGSRIPLDESDKTEIGCENGEQLYYLAMNGYKPKPLPGSVAEALYDAAKQVVYEYVNDEMSDFEKIKAVYDYMTGEIRYDAETAYSQSTYLVKEQAYYLEGVFFNKCAVCDGKSKAYALLLNMVNIPCFRITGKNGDADHAWNVVGLDGKRYLSCTTYGQPAAIAFGETLKLIVPNYSFMLASKTTPYGDTWGYVPQKHLSECDLLESEPFDVYKEMSEGSVNLKINGIDEFRSLMKSVQEHYETSLRKIEFSYIGDDCGKFQEELISYLSTAENVNLLSPRSETGKIYEVVFLK